MLLYYRPQYERHNNRHSTPWHRIPNFTAQGNDDVMQTEMYFLQTSATFPGIDGVTYEDMKCYAYQKVEHYAGQCPGVPSITRRVNMLQLEEKYPTEEEYVSDFTFLKNDSSRFSHISLTWILLDSYSTVSVFKSDSTYSTLGMVLEY